MRKFDGQFRDWEPAIQDPEIPITAAETKLFIDRCINLSAAAEVDVALQDELQSATTYEVFRTPIVAQIRKLPENPDDELNRMAVLAVNATDVQNTEDYLFYRTNFLRYLVGYKVDESGRIDHSYGYMRGFDREEAIRNASTNEDIETELDRLRQEAEETGDFEAYHKLFGLIRELEVESGGAIFTQARFIEAMRAMDLAETARNIGEFSQFDPAEEQSPSITPEQRRFFKERVRELIEIDHKNGKAVHQLPKYHALVFLDAARDDAVEVVVEQVLPVPGRNNYRLNIINTFGLEPVAAYCTSTAIVSDGRGKAFADDRAKKILEKALEIDANFQGPVNNYYGIKAHEDEAGRDPRGAKTFLPEYYEYVMGVLYDLGPDTFQEEATEALF